MRSGSARGGRCANEGAQVSRGYLSALDDAKRKAALLAKYAGAALGAVESIGEGYGGQPPASFNNPLKGAASSIRDPRLLVNGPVVLAVTYRLGGDPQRTISILGYGANAIGRSALRARSNTTCVVVSVNAQGKDLADAAHNAAPYEAVIHKAAARVGLPDSAISKSEGSFNSY